MANQGAAQVGSSEPHGATGKKRHVARWVAVALAVIVLVCAVGFAVYVNDYYRASSGNEVYLASTTDLEVHRSEGIVAFGNSDASAGLIVYPGAKVAYDAYAPLARELAERGVFCAVVEVPFNIAFFDSNAASRVIELYPDIETWYVAGHSLGGVVASGWAADHVDELSGVVLLASYSTADLSQSGLSVLSLYGSEDEVLNRDAYEDALSNLPSDFEEGVIVGGNHAQFGNYGEQAGDGAAAISPRDQWEETADAIASFAGIAG